MSAIDLNLCECLAILEHSLFHAFYFHFILHVTSLALLEI